MWVTILSIFIARQLCYARYRDRPSVCPSVRPSVCDTLVLCLNGWTYREMHRLYGCPAGAVCIAEAGRGPSVDFFIYIYIYLGGLTVDFFRAKNCDARIPEDQSSILTLGPPIYLYITNDAPRRRHRRAMAEWRPERYTGRIAVPLRPRVREIREEDRASTFIAWGEMVACRIIYIYIYIYTNKPVR